MMKRAESFNERCWGDRPGRSAWVAHAQQSHETLSWENPTLSPLIPSRRSQNRASPAVYNTPSSAQQPLRQIYSIPGMVLPPRGWTSSYRDEIPTDEEMSG